MPAGENTKYSQKTLHRVFGCSALVLLISTIWMFAADHYREWKGYQRENRRIETTLTEWRRDAQMSREVTARIGELHEIGALALYLCSPASSFVTGSLFSIDGGWIAE